MTDKSEIKSNDKIDYMHPDGKPRTNPKTLEEKDNKAKAEESTELAEKLKDDGSAKNSDMEEK